jgi:hypothetical protein
VIRVRVCRNKTNILVLVTDQEKGRETKKIEEGGEKKGEEGRN